jgi:glycerol-1-phosphate dehydrogenase [NAD(P)+]
MIRDNLPVYIGDNALDHLVEYCHTNNLNRFTLIADENTYPVLGAAAEKALKDSGLDVGTVVLKGTEVVADEHYIMQVFVSAEAEDRVYLAVGSGTITDITRFVSHRSHSTFISLPTAPSVDGFTSIVAPLVIKGLKITAQTHPPRALFADLPTLCAAPRRMIAAGFGDMIGKYTSIADWRLGNLLWDGDYSEPIAQRVLAALARCVEHAREIGSGSPEGVQSIMEGLIESGFCMVDFGRSLPASGSEHHLSHYWEMKLLREGRPAILHGAKVAVGTVFAAGRYEQFRKLTRGQVARRLDATPLPDRAREIEHIRAGYGPIAEQVIVEQAPFLDLNEGSFSALKQRVVDQWDAIQEIAATVPSARQIAALIEQVGGIVDPAALGLDSEYVSEALRYSHYLRNNFTAMKLGWLLGIA